jgi:hypothetical protein
MRFPPLLLLALVTAPLARAQSSGEPSRALPESQLRLDVGALASGYTVVGGSTWDGFAVQALSGHKRWGGFTLDADVTSLVPLEAHGPGASLSLTVRAGYTGERWSLVGGPVLNLGYTALPALQVLPSLKALYRLGPVDLHAGLFDAHGLVPLDVGASFKGVGLAYVLPLGARAWVDVPLTRYLDLHVEGFAYRLVTAQSALLTVGLALHPAPPSAGAP